MSASFALALSLALTASPEAMDASRSPLLASPAPPPAPWIALPGEDAAPTAAPPVVAPKAAPIAGSPPGSSRPSAPAATEPVTGPSPAATSPAPVDAAAATAAVPAAAAPMRDEPPPAPSAESPEPTAPAATVAEVGGAVAPPTAAPGSEGPLGIRAALRLGLAVPFGDALDAFDFAVPISADVWRPFDDRLDLGGTLSFGKIPFDGARVRWTRLGVAAGWRPPASLVPEVAGFQPWFGADLSAEFISLFSSLSAARLNGLIADVAVAGERTLEPGLVVGPYLEASVARFGTITDKRPSEDDSDSTDDYPGPAFHGWLTLGVRGRLDL